MYIHTIGSSAQNAVQRFDPIQMILSPTANDWIYPLHQTAEVNVYVLQYGVPLKNIEIRYTLANDMLKADTQKSEILNNGIGVIPVKSTDEAGFRQLTVKCQVDGKTYQEMVTLGFSPEKIQPTVNEPQDFDLFWESTIKKARQQEAKVTLQKLNKYCTPEVNVYLWSMATGIANHRISGYLCKPNNNDKHPVLFAPPGAGVKSIEPYLGFAEAGYISLSIEIHGINPLPNAKRYHTAQKALGDYWTSGMNDPNDYYYKAVYAGCVRAIDYLCSLKEYNGNCVVTGGSQGGALAIVTAALNPKVDALAAFYPALSDMTGFLHQRGGGWPQLFQDSKATNEQINTLAYYDVVNFAKRIKVPGFYSTGFNDKVCCPTSVYAAFNAISAPKEMYITPPCGHWRFEIANKKSLEFLKNQLNPF